MIAEGLNLTYAPLISLSSTQISNNPSCVNSSGPVFVYFLIDK